MENERFDRQIRVFGMEGQQKLLAEKVGIVGLGGIGSQVVQALTFLGIRSFVLVDGDSVEETNLNRLVGATLEDALNHTPKVRVAERIIRSVNINPVIQVIATNLRTKEAIEALTTCTSIFGCVDTDSARLIFSELAAAYSIPLIDVATEIDIENGPTVTFGGRVVVARPGDLCLMCAGVVDMKVAKQELEDDDTRKVRKQHGYGLGDQVPSPAVVSLNGTLANLAVTEFMMMITGFRQPNRFLHYRGERGIGGGSILNNRDIPYDPKCFTCKALVGVKEASGLDRYIKN